LKPKPQFSREIHPLLQRRWSPRAFSARPVEEATLLTLLEAARWAASANNEQPWRFIYATKAQGERYAMLFDCLNEWNQAWVHSAPALIMTLVRTHFEKNGRQNRWALHDLVLAVGNLTAQASALDLYVHSMGGFSIEKARELFRLPSDVEPVTMIAAGYLGDPEQLPDSLKVRELAQQQRKPLEELIFGEISAKNDVLVD
jgi:nitroreductase